MRAVNVVVYLLLTGSIVAGNVLSGEGKKKWKHYIEKYWYLLGILMLVNTISFAMTFTPEKTEIFVEKAGYGQEERKVPFLLENEKEKEEIELTVSARKLTQEQLQEKVTEAFAYLEENLQGENEALSKVYSSLDYSLDVEQFPFDVEFASEDSALIDGEGNVKNEKEYLLSLGFTKKELEKGIPITVTITLWYEEENFQQIYSLVMFPKQRGETEEQFFKVKEFLGKKEKEASHK